MTEPMSASATYDARVAVTTPSPAAIDRDVATLAARLVPAMPAGGWRGWAGPLAVTALAAVLRLHELGRPHAIAFDETYYPKDALSLLEFGVERSIREDANALILASDGDWRALDLFLDTPAFVVHPPLGKWTIAAGEAVFGATPFGWRIAVAVLGIIAVLLTARIVRRLTRSNLIGTIAGLLLAIDGMHLVLSRTGLLDLTLGFWVLVAFGCLLVDRDHTRARLARGPIAPSTWGPRFGLRPWRLAAAVALGLACSVKWSGLWFVLAFGLMTVVWDVGTRRAIGVRRPWGATLLRDAPIAAASWLVIIAGLYLASWTGWFLSDLGYARDWAASQPPSVVPDALRSWWHYHGEAWRFHVGLSSEHSYESNPLSWPLQTRPTSFFWSSGDDLAAVCDAPDGGDCAQEVLALGNPIIWWAGLLAMVHQLWRWAARRDWRSGAVLVGIAAGWLPWMLYLDRTIFTFYTVVYVPFVCMALAMTLGTVIGPRDASEARRQWGAFAAGAIIVAAVLVAWWMLPIWTGEVIPYDQWRLRMWMPTWI